ncbi:hybrid sensor histidine kinase/response regulator [Blastopirellula marina]|uniref:histidine kinase n=1 Tax=Blastopirellula marina TaxID=124 RepID=A0A2S8G2V8_9BACT|nr:MULTISPECIES: response regulator [Pirellulaceae]PQO38778.1 hybrid sensor histidine kinase/response regulator [Blastopirellula marina]RCS55086.1 hybrid sensor histidine kinase/response regulator [Bremerella cremea]
MRVLVAEDGMMMRRILVRALEGWKYEVTEVENGAQAWEAFEAEPFRLVLTDWVMPEVDGLDLIRRIRSAKLPFYVYIILLTAKSEKEDLVVGMEAGADDFLVKPVDHNELRVRLREGERIVRLEQELAEQNRQLRETQAALVQSEKLASLGQMAAGMAHEINNPIALVANNLAVLKRDVSSAFELLDMYRSIHDEIAKINPELAKNAAELEEDCDYQWIRDESPELFDRSLTGLQRVRDIVQNLRSFARLDEAELDHLDVNAALFAVSQVLHHEIEARQIELIVDPGDIPLILCEPVKIQQVLHHLLLNAIQASDVGGKVTLSSSRCDEGVQIDVQDHGCGMSGSDLAHIFEPFFTTRAVGSGQGLGLAVSYGIVRDHGGSIQVRSQLGRGTTFSVQLPVRPLDNQSPGGSHES